MDGCTNCLVDSMACYIGQTVTIFTTSGGLSGSGFTGVLISADCNCVRLLCDIGAGPACPIGSGCGSRRTSCGGNSGGQSEFCGNPLGAVAVIPTRAIACFTHCAI